MRMECSGMSKVLQGIGIFVAMFAVAFLAAPLLDSSSDSPLSGSFDQSGSLLLLVIVLAIAIAVPIARSAFWKFRGDIGGIQGNLKLAERELVKILGDNWDQGGRQGKVKERSEWAAMAHPTIVHTLKDDELAKLAAEPGKWSPMVQPSITLIYQEGYRSVAHEAFELNKDDMKNRGAAMGKASMTAALLRELYQGNAGGAVKKVLHEYKIGNTPFVAPGIRELLDFDKFDADKKEFPKDHKPVNGIMLTLAVEHGKFPKELILMDKGVPYRGWEVIRKLTEPAPPEGWDIPKTPADISMLRLWWKWLTWWD